MAEESIPVTLQGTEPNKAVLHAECQHFEAAEDRRNCEQVYATDYVIWSEKMLADEQFVSDLDVIDMSDVGDNKHLRQKRSARGSKCPTFNTDYTTRNRKKVNQLSISPWKYVLTYDKNRLPRRLLNATCLCDGCINIRTLREDQSVISKELYFEILIMKNNKLTKQRVNNGCFCSLPLLIEKE
ncbi:interleukin-17C-like [Styela clava]